MTKHAFSAYPPGSVYAIEFGCRCRNVPTNAAGLAVIFNQSDCPLHGESHEEQCKADEREGVIGGDVCEVD